MPHVIVCEISCPYLGALHGIATRNTIDQILFADARNKAGKKSRLDKIYLFRRLAITARDGQDRVEFIACFRNYFMLSVVQS